MIWLRITRPRSRVFLAIYDQSWLAGRALRGARFFRGRFFPISEVTLDRKVSGAIRGKNNTRTYAYAHKRGDTSTTDDDERPMKKLLRGGYRRVEKNVRRWPSSDDERAMRVA